MKAKEKYFKTLNEHLKYAKEQLNLADEQIVGIFLYGSQNYGTDGQNSDVDSHMIVLPTFEDFCLDSKNLISKEILFGEQEEHINVKDIRLYRENLLKQNINFVETLFTEYFILNPMYEDLFKKFFFQEREAIAKLDMRRAVMSIGHQAIYTLRQKSDEDKKLYNGHRLLFFLQNYITDTPYEECLKPNKHFLSDLARIKEGTYNYIFSKNTVKENLIKEFFEIIEANKDIYSPLAETGLQAVNDGTTAILKKSFEPLFKEKKTSKEEFIKSLTKSELMAYCTITEEIGYEGTIVISKLVKESGISRPVYNNLLAKMKEHRVAEISNMGVKGTYINITQPELKANLKNI